MKKYLLYLLLLLTGLLNSFAVIALAGIFYPLDVITWTVKMLKELELIYLGSFAVYFIAQSTLALISLPFFLLSAYMFTRYTRMSTNTISTLSSTGVALFVAIAGYVDDPGPLIYLLDLLILVIMNATSIYAMEKHLKAREYA
ncbi:hypothetical protein WCX18_06955 [Sulfurimonas sp. HSL1-2]|uniref:hypothetical protein n=1 Tax=Thiomicrolovo zhangzhouensis TaxID=3131933 RepID=UPI0031F8ABE7